MRLHVHPHSPKARLWSRTGGAGLIVVLALLAGLLAASSRAAPSAPIALLTVGSGATSNLDSARADTLQTFVIDDLMLDKLLVMDAHGNLKPNLATSWSSPNPRTYVYHLRHGVKFWDGHAMTASDVAASLNYWRYPKFPTAGQPGFGAVKSIVATNRYTVLVTLRKPDASWKYVPAITGWIFEAAFQKAHGADMGKPGVLIMGSGPWEPNSFDPTSGVELSANPNWWGGKVNIQHISIKFINDATSQALALRSGQLNVVPFIAGGFSAFQSTANLPVHSIVGCGLYYMAMNTQSGPFADVHVRRAIAYAINRSDLIAAAGGPSDGSPVTTLITPANLLELASKSQVNTLLTKTLPQYPYDLAKAKHEMSLSHFPNGFSFDLPVGPSPVVFGTLSQAIAGMLQKIGITANLQSLSQAQSVAKVSAPLPAGQAMVNARSCQPDASVRPDQLLWSKSITFGLTNGSSYSNPAADALIVKGQEAQDPATRFAIYSKLLNIVAQDAPYVPLFTLNIGYAMQSQFEWSPSIWWYFGGNPWALNITSR